MKTDRIAYTPSFSSLKFDSEVSKGLQKALKKSPAGKKFGRKYDAIVSTQVFMSASDASKTYVGLLFRNIKDNNILGKIFDKLFDSSTGGALQYNSRCQTEEELIRQLPKLHKDTFVAIYNAH